MSVAEQYRVRVLAYAATNGAVVSHSSAAALLGLPLLRPDRTAVHFTSDGRGGGNKSSSRIFHRAPLGSEDIVMVDGIAVTSPMRTALDVGCAGTFARCAQSNPHCGCLRSHLEKFWVDSEDEEVSRTFVRPPSMQVR